MKLHGTGLLIKIFTIFTLFTQIILQPCFSLSCNDSINPVFLKSLSALKIKITTTLLTDYANLKRSNHCYLEAYPHNTNEVAGLINFAYQKNIPIRIQGNAHSENGSTLPGFPELLIHTDYLNTVKFEKRGEVTTGAGIPMSLLDEYIRKSSDYALPVLNGGGMGPTVGGFFSAGGISTTSEMYGGFWNHVLEVTLVTEYGKIVHVKPGDEIFSWIFGSMGQLGVITEAKLVLIPAKNNQHPAYPFNKVDHISYQHEDYFSENHKPLYWFNLFVAKNQLSEARQILTEFQKHHPLVLNYYPIYEWGVNHNHFLPPLIFSGEKDFTAIGSWGPAGPEFSHDKLSAMEKEFDALAIKYHYHRYIQAEMADKPAVFAAYFGPATYQSFRALKVKLDPKFLFNRGSVFA